MRSLIFIILFFSSVFLCAQDHLEWTQNYRLVYGDFKGAVPAGESKSTKATTYSVIDLDVQQVGQEVHTYVRTYFKYYSSWMRPDSKNEYTLKHEQGHFDITEIYSRKLRKKLSETKVKRRGGDKQIVSIAKKMVKQHLKAQAKYDKVTGLAIEEMKQNEYLVKIAIELKSLEAYKNSKVVMGFR